MIGVRSLALALLLAPAAALAQAPRTFRELADLLVALIDTATGILIVAGIVIYFFGVSTHLMKKGEEDRHTLRNYIVWGIVVIFVMVSIWGIIDIIQGTVFEGDVRDPTTGENGGDAFGLPDFE